MGEDIRGEKETGGGDCVLIGHNRKSLIRGGIQGQEKRGTNEGLGEGESC